MKLRNFKMAILVLLLTIGLFLSSCKKFIEVGAPKSSIVPSTVFESDDLAVSAMLGIYQQMAVSGYASGDGGSIPTLCGLAADELLGYNTVVIPFAQNEILADNATIRSVWTTCYARIYNANTILEGLLAKNGVSESVARQLEGEALFTRAFNYFYLHSLFGEVPLNLDTDYAKNAKALKATSSEIYRQILLDLQNAESRLSENYISVERIRPNKAAAQALMAKIYLALKDWVNAKKYASLVINRTGVYQLTGIDDVFLKNSKEAIWQLMPTAGSNTLAGNLFILTTTPSSVSLRPEYINNIFEAGDLRKASWVKNITAQGSTYYYPFKYKIRSSTTVTEYFMMLRIAEQYLIRAEAAANLDQLTIGISDLDQVRQRAGLTKIIDIDPGVGRDALLELIYKERNAELFSEWGNRWFDLKRTQRLNTVLSPIKPKWKNSFGLFPIPKIEIDNNRNITQNEGY